MIKQLLAYFLILVSVCPEWTFGKKCKSCSCNKTNADSCDHITGKCKCKPGFSGATCDCSKGNDPCNATISDCHSTNKSQICLCKPEYLRKNLTCTGNFALFLISKFICIYYLKLSRFFRLLNRQRTHFKCQLCYLYPFCVIQLHENPERI